MMHPGTLLFSFLLRLTILEEGISNTFAKYSSFSSQLINGSSLQLEGWAKTQIMNESILKNSYVYIISPTPGLSDMIVTLLLTYFIFCREFHIGIFVRMQTLVHNSWRLRMTLGILKFLHSYVEFWRTRSSPNNRRLINEALFNAVQCNVWMEMALTNNKNRGKNKVYFFKF